MVLHRGDDCVAGTRKSFREGVIHMHLVIVMMFWWYDVKRLPPKPEAVTPIEIS